MCSSAEEEETQSSLNPSFLPESERVRENSAFLVRFEVTFVRGNAVNKAREGRWKMQDPPLQTRDRKSLLCLPYKIPVIMVQDYRSPQFINR